MKTLTTLTMVAALQAFGAENSVGIWHFDANGGQLAADSSAYGNSGQLGASMGADPADPTWTAGKFGTALQFNGSSQYVQVPSSASLSITGSLTVEAWVNPAAYNSDWNGVIARWDDTAGAQRSWALSIHPGGWVRFDVSHTGHYGPFSGPCNVVATYQLACTDSAQVYSANPIPTDRWTHIAGVFDAAHKTLQVFIDGSPDTSVPTMGSSLFDSGKPVLIGANDFTGKRVYFNGVIDEPRVWNRALSAAEVLSSAQAGLRGLWHFNSVSGPSTVMTPDSSRMGNDAVVVGPTVTASGRFGNALSWDGQNDYAYAGTNPSLSITGPLTLEAWVNMNGLQPNQQGFAPIIAKWNDQPGNDARGYVLTITPDGSVRFDISHNGHFSCALNQLSCADANSAYVKSAKKIALHAWTHIAGAFDGKTLQVFVNGVPDTSIATVLSNINAVTYPVAFGFAYVGTVGPQFANGVIDEAKIWARGLSASEVAFEAVPATSAELQLPTALSQDGLNNNGAGNGAGAIGATDLPTTLKNAMFLEFLNPDAPGVSISSINGHVSNGNGASLLGWVVGNGGLDALMTVKSGNPSTLNNMINLSDKSKVNVSVNFQ